MLQGEWMGSYEWYFGLDQVKKLFALDKEELIKIIIDDAKDLFAMDGVWFQSLEFTRGIDEALKFDEMAWKRFSIIEAKRIMERLNIEPGGGIPALMNCLEQRQYARLNKIVFEKVEDNKLIYKMATCRIQEARKRKGLSVFPCKTIGIIEYGNFARTVDPRIKTNCLVCPPDDSAKEECWCKWEFVIEDSNI